MDFSNSFSLDSRADDASDSADFAVQDTEVFAQNGEVEICLERMGPRDAPAVLLIMGLGGQLISWPMSLCNALVAAGFQVIRFDNRDSGRSSDFEHAGHPRLIRVAAAAAMKRQLSVPYVLDDMASDAIAVLDHLQLPQAHVVGVSMGGMIAQILAAKFPQRFLSLSSWMSSSGDPKLPGPSPKLKLWMIRRRRTDAEGALEEMVRGLQMTGSPGFRRSNDELREILRPQVDRGLNPSGTRRQMAAILASGPRTRLLAKIKIPSLILHGAEDPLIPMPAAIDLGRRISGSRVEIIPGLGHDLPDAVMPRIADSLIRHFQTGRAQAFQAA